MDVYCAYANDSYMVAMVSGLLTRATREGVEEAHHPVVGGVGHPQAPVGADGQATGRVELPVARAGRPERGLEPSVRIEHWITLLRARAIENLAYVIAPAQGGYHVNGRETHGHTMIVDPWGVVLDRLPRGSGVVVAGVNPTYQAKVRRSLPALTHKTVRQW